LNLKILSYNIISKNVIATTAPGLYKFFGEGTQAETRECSRV